MWGRIFERKNIFLELIEKSAEKIREGGMALLDLMQNYTEVEKKTRNIKEIEKECDDITHEVFEKLSTIFVTPIDREDIHLLISRMDDVMDMIHAVSERLVIFKITEICPQAIQLMEVFLKSINEICEGIKHLKHLGKAFNILRHCVEINRLENDGDEITRKAIGNLFDNAHDPLHVIKWKEIYETLEEGIDRCEDVANVIETIILKNA